MNKSKVKKVDFAPLYFQTYKDLSCNGKLSNMYTQREQHLYSGLTSSQQCGDYRHMVGTGRCRNTSQNWQGAT